VSKLVRENLVVNEILHVRRSKLTFSNSRFLSMTNQSQLVGKCF